jgi:long-chain acyl-CoA synthetase
MSSEHGTALDIFDAAVAHSRTATALAFFDGKLSYAEFDRLSDGLAAFLRSEGLRAGDRLGLLMQNVPQFPIAMVAAWKLGAIVVPINPMYRYRELETVLQRAGVTAIVTSTAAWNDLVREVANTNGIRIAVTTDETELQTRDDRRVFEPLLSSTAAAEGSVDLLDAARRYAAHPVERAEVTPADPALLCFTSGTSGIPKAAINTHGNIAAIARIMQDWSQLERGAGVFALAPLFHITGLIWQIAFALQLAGPLVLAYRFHPTVAVDAIAEHSPAFTVGPPTAFMALLAHADPDADLSSLQVIACGGAALAPAVLREFEQRFSVPLSNGYGLTETTAPCTMVPVGQPVPIDPRSGTLSVGRPLPHTSVRILDDDGQELPAGEVGEIAIEGPMVIPGYWNMPEETAAAIPDGALRTGDVGFLDDAGWLYVVDRKKDMINAAGFKVWPREVEDVLYEHPAVREAAVVGVPDDYRGETVKAFVSLRAGHEGTTDVHLIEHCRQHLAAYKAPRLIEILDELPKTLSGKILRRSLRGGG